ncbi:MAG: hypothetical protein WCP92_05520 [bacterium]
MSVLSHSAPANIKGLRVTADTKFAARLRSFHFPSTLEKLRKLSAIALSACICTSLIFFVELNPCLETFHKALAISPHRLTGVAMVFPTLKAPVSSVFLNFPMYDSIQINITIIPILLKLSNIRRFAILTQISINTMKNERLMMND